MSIYETPPPILLDAPSPRDNPALLVFLHGFDDDGEAFRGLAAHLQSQPDLSHLHIILPTAPLDHESMARAWYPVTAFSPIPMGQNDSKSSVSGSDPTDIDSLIASADKVRSIISDVANMKELPLGRTILGRFSQGSAISLTIGVGATARDDQPELLASVVGLCGYLPQLPRVEKILERAIEANVGSTIVKNFFVAEGGRDILIPGWLRTETVERVQKVANTAHGEHNSNVATKIYDGVDTRYRQAWQAILWSG